MSRVVSSLCVLAIIFPLTVGNISAEASSPALCAASTATGMIRAYYRALNDHRPAAARACLTPKYLARMSRPNVVDPDWKNVISAHVKSIRAWAIGAGILPPDVTPKPYRAVQIVARVNMRYRQIGGSPNGLNIWFIYVIKQRPSSPWRIADIGSGP